MPVLSKEFLEIQGTIECGFTLKCVRDMIRTNSIFHRYIHSVNCTNEKCLSTVALSVENVGKIIQNFDSHKAHGHDNISIRMLKIFVDSIYKLLEIIFSQALLTGVFPSE